MMSGCYTQLGTLRNSPENIPQIVDSTGDTIKQNIQVDTVVVKERQNCVWERDMWGYPQLRCYDSYYPRDWFFYTRTPWWFRNDPYWYDYRRCPRYYYYDQSCGRCRHYQDRSYHRTPNTSGSSGTPQGGNKTGSSSGAVSRSRSGGLTVNPSSSEMPKTNQTPVVPAQSIPQSPIHRDRSSGISDIPNVPSGQQGKTISGGDQGPERSIHSDEPKRDINDNQEKYRGRKSSRGL